MRAAWVALTIATLFFVFEFLARVEPSLAAPAIAEFYGIKSGAFGALASLFFWVYAPMQIVVGLLLDRYGARPFILLGSFCCAAGVAAFAATPSVPVGALGRALTGFGASFAFVGALYIVNHWFAPERFAFLSGAVNGAGMIGAAIGAPILSRVIAAQGWQWTFLATAGVGAAIFLTALLFLRVVQSPATVATTSTVEHVRRSLSDALANPRTWAISVIGLFGYMPVNVYAGLWGNSQLVAEHGMTPNEAAFGVSLIFWGLAAGSVASGYVADYLGNRKQVLMAGTVLAALAYASVLYVPTQSLWQVDLLLALAGFFNASQMLTFTMAKEGERSSLTGTVVAFVNMVGIAGALLFQPLVGYIADVTGGDFRIALSTIPLCLCAAIVMLAFLTEHRHPDHVPGARVPAAAPLPA
jgi:MFS family permease